METPTQKSKICDYLAGEIVPSLPEGADKASKKANSKRQKQVSDDLKQWVMDGAKKEWEAAGSKGEFSGPKILKESFEYVVDENNDESYVTDAR